MRFKIVILMSLLTLFMLGQAQAQYRSGKSTGFSPFDRQIRDVERKLNTIEARENAALNAATAENSAATKQCRRINAGWRKKMVGILGDFGDEKHALTAKLKKLNKQLKAYKRYQRRRTRQ